MHWRPLGFVFYRVTPRRSIFPPCCSATFQGLRLLHSSLCIRPACEEWGNNMEYPREVCCDYRIGILWARTQVKGLRLTARETTKCRLAIYLGKSRNRLWWTQSLPPSLWQLRKYDVMRIYLSVWFPSPKPITPSYSWQKYHTSPHWGIVYRMPECTPQSCQSQSSKTKKVWGTVTT